MTADLAQAGGGPGLEAWGKKSRDRLDRVPARGTRPGIVRGVSAVERRVSAPRPASFEAVAPHPRNDSAAGHVQSLGDFALIAAKFGKSKLQEFFFQQIA